MIDNGEVGAHGVRPLLDSRLPSSLRYAETSRGNDGFFRLPVVGRGLSPPVETCPCWGTGI